MKNLFTFIYFPFNKKMIKEMSPYIKKGDRFLDFGCGHATMSFLVSRDLGAKTTGIDVRDVRDFKIPFKKYDGQNILFPDNHFDAVLSSYVLHHAPDAGKLLREIKRVCRRYIIIYEDTPTNHFQRVFCRLHGRFFNGFFKIGSKCSFLSIEEWQKIFQKERLKLVHQKHLKLFNPFYITRRTLFVLEK